MRDPVLCCEKCGVQPPAAVLRRSVKISTSSIKSDNESVSGRLSLVKSTSERSPRKSFPNEASNSLANSSEHSSRLCRNSKYNKNFCRNFMLLMMNLFQSSSFQFSRNFWDWRWGRLRDWATIEKWNQRDCWHKCSDGGLLHNLFNWKVVVVKNIWSSSVWNLYVPHRIQESSCHSLRAQFLSELLAKVNRK